MGQGKGEGIEGSPGGSWGITISDLVSSNEIATPQRCHASVCSSVLCLVTTKIWSDGH